MSKRPKPVIRLDEATVAADPSYVINPVDSGLILRSFIFQSRGQLCSPDGKVLSNITADDIDWGVPEAGNDEKQRCREDNGNGGSSSSAIGEGGEGGRKLVGRGASGCVYHARLKGTSTPIAVKCIPISNKSHRDEVARELAFLTSKYDTEFVVANYGAFWHAEEHIIAIAMEWMAYSLADLVKFNDGLPSEEVARDIIYQLLRGLAYLHDVKKVIHRDIKPGNVLISPKGEVKIGDFGVSRIVETLNFTSTYVGTMQYMAPERLEEGCGYSFAADVWSLGLTFVASATGKSPFGEVNLFQLMQKLDGGEMPALPESYSDLARDFTSLCLKRDPNERARCSELLKHPFFAECTPSSSRENIMLLMSQTSRLVQQAAKLL